jgi:16S rRNA U1498 N3-methylase RsmE
MKNVRLYQNRALSVGDLVTLDAYASHHLSKVLRFPEGKNITLFNGDGMNYSAQVLQTKKDKRTFFIIKHRSHFIILKMIPKNRREKLLSQLDDGALVIISTNPQQYCAFQKVKISLYSMVME